MTIWRWSRPGSTADRRARRDGESISAFAVAADLPGILHVRHAVRENTISPHELARRGITSETIAASLRTHRKGWVAEHENCVVAFSMADRANLSIFALFVLPDYEGRGLGSRLLGFAVDWLWDGGADSIWLTTGPETRAAGFYQRKGWIKACVEPDGELRFELRRPSNIG